MKKEEIKSLITLVTFLVVAFVTMILIGASIPVPAEPGSSQNFVQFCLNAKTWLVGNGVLLAIVVVGIFLLLRIVKVKKRK